MTSPHRSPRFRTPPPKRHRPEPRTHTTDVERWVRRQFLSGKVPCATTLDTSATNPTTFCDIDVDNELKDAAEHWTHQMAWTNMVTDLFYPIVDASFARLDSGSFNRVWRVIEPNSTILDATRWPPQLRGNNLVVRISKRPYDTAASEDSSGVEAYARHTSSCKPFSSNSFRETAITLRMAMLGVGPRVFAVARWPESVVRRDATGHGLTMVLEYAGVTLNHRFSKRSTEPEVTFVTRAVISMLHAVADAGFIHYDVKPCNICVARDDTVKLLDFDSEFVIDTHELFDFKAERLTDKAADWARHQNRLFNDQMMTKDGAEPRFFIMLLLLTVHVRQYSTEVFRLYFLKYVEPILMKIWITIRHNRGFLICDSICDAEMKDSADKGAFDSGVLAATPHAVDRTKLMLEYMTFEYVFRDHEGIITASKRWRSHGGRDQWTACPRQLGVVPRLLRFALYYDGLPRNLPRDWADALR